MQANKEDIGARLKIARHSLGLPSGEFAKQVSIDPRNYSSIETGKRNIGEKVLKKICDAFQINLDWVLTGEGYMLVKKTSININDSQVISIPVDAWEVIKHQAESLNAKDKQMDELIQMLRDQLYKKTAVQAADNAECAGAAV